MSKTMIGLVGVTGAVILGCVGPLSAADLQVPRPTAYCGPCGCLQVAYVYHREFLTTYGLSYDARNYDTTEPHFYLSRGVHAYPRYYVEGSPVPGPGSCLD